VSPQINEQALLAQIRSGNEEEILAAFEEAVRVFVGADDPLITGEHERFRPSTWGFTKTQLRFDGQSVNADIRFLVQGSVSGRVVNHQGVPIGARVRLTGSWSEREWRADDHDSRRARQRSGDGRVHFPRPVARGRVGRASGLAVLSHRSDAEWIHN
jgi:hypothetical protein